jgi:hypothetical protein
MKIYETKGVARFDDGSEKKFPRTWRHHVEGIEEFREAAVENTKKSMRQTPSLVSTFFISREVPPRPRARKSKPKSPFQGEFSGLGL